MKFGKLMRNRLHLAVFIGVLVLAAAGTYLVIAWAQGASVTCTANVTATTTICRSTNGAGIDEDGDGLIDEDPFDSDYTGADEDDDGDGPSGEDPSGGDEDTSTLPIDAVTPRGGGLPTVFTAKGDSALIEADDNDATQPDGDGVCDGFCLGGDNDTAYIRDPGGVAANKNPIEVFGEDGDDTIIDHSRGAGNNELQGGNGNDVLIGDAAETLIGGNGNDLLAGGVGNDSLAGTLTATGWGPIPDPGDDTFIGGPGLDWKGMGAGDGNDNVVFQAGDVPPAPPAAPVGESWFCFGTDNIFVVGMGFDGTRQNLDDDGDGFFDEDSDFMDDDGDGLIDEDPPDGIDQDGDGVFDEDPINDNVDDDHDNLIDEDPGVRVADPVNAGGFYEFFWGDTPCTVVGAD